MTNSDENRTTAAPATDPTGALCFYEIALDGTVTSLNPAGRLQLGLDPESDSIKFRYLDVINAQDQLRVEDLLQAAFHGDSSAFEFLSNGVVSQTLTARFIPIKDFDGAVTKMVGVTHGGAEAHGRVTSPGPTGNDSRSSRRTAHSRGTVAVRSTWPNGAEQSMPWKSVRFASATLPRSPLSRRGRSGKSRCAGYSCLPGEAR